VHGVSARYERPATIGEATRLLAAGGWRVLAGGTDLYPAHVGRAIASPLLDVTAVAELRGIRRTASGWSIGAATTWTDLLRADLPARFDALKQAAREIGGVQIQNAATVAGNLCNASPAADGIPVLMAMDAVVVLHSARAERRVPATEFVQGNRRTAGRPDELVVALEIPEPAPGARSAFVKLGARRYLVISISMVAVVVDLDDAAGVARAAIAVGSCAARAQRLPRLEQRLAGRALDGLAATEIEADDLTPLAPIDDVRASAGYRVDATASLLRRALRALGEPRSDARGAAA
jgi:CO/xanthine dehydrogenase FAD-binding subunit